MTSYPPSLLFFEGVYVVYLFGQTVLGAYFAWAVDRVLTPYFEAHGMGEEVRQTRLVFTYLTVAAVLSAVNALATMLMNWSRAIGARIAQAVLLACWGASMGLGIVTTVHAASWWQYFDGRGDEVHLARIAHALAGTMIGSTVLGWFLMFVIFLFAAWGAQNQDAMVAHV